MEAEVEVLFLSLLLQGGWSSLTNDTMRSGDLLIIHVHSHATDDLGPWHAAHVHRHHHLIDSFINVFVPCDNQWLNALGERTGKNSTVVSCQQIAMDGAPQLVCHYLLRVRHNDIASYQAMKDDGDMTGD